jgi:predicted alpha/beta-hydrolase family hydrolase
VTGPVAGLLLTPGAGGDRSSPALVAIEQALAGDPVTVERMDFPYRRAGRRRPDRPPALVEAIRQGAAGRAARGGLEPAEVVVGGRSMGGRMSSLAVAEGVPARGLVLLSYPLHPPGRPDQLRVEHFPALSLPCLFVSGTRDAFAWPEELEAATASIPGRVTHVWLDGGDHGLRGKDTSIAEAVRAWLLALVQPADRRSLARGGS